MNDICNKDREQILKESIEQGKSLGEVALSFGVTKSTVRRWALRHDLTFKTQSPWRK